MKKFLYNNKVLKSRRQGLRIDGTEVEKLVWYRIRNRQILNLKFFRQYSIGHYILDFYCPQAKLGIELDGGHHAEEERVMYDKERTEYISNFDIKIMRFWNNEVGENIESVMEEIIKECHNSLNPSYLKREGE